MSEADYWAGLQHGMRAKLTEIAWRYLRLETIPDHETAVQLLALQQLDIEVMEAHNRWLERVKAKVEAAGLPWTHENMLLYCQLGEVE
ncbi:hypothetical protein [Mycobacterium kansasii]|uniref:hypothetical protein n=1 Tax=Mycobacterium kansasii TaxID=1768 RepID=UPI003A898B7D